MRTMISFDWETIRRSLPSFLVSAVLVWAAMTVMSRNASAAVGAIIAMEPLVILFTLAALDEAGNWERFRLALPLSRADVVRGRYAMTLLACVAACACALALYAAVIVAARLMPGVTLLIEVAASTHPDTIATCSVAAVCITLILTAIVLPFVFSFGMTKAVRYLPIGIVLVGLVVYLSLGDALVDLIYDLLATWTQTDFILAGVCALGASLALFAASCLLSTRLYDAREL